MGTADDRPQQPGASDLLPPRSGKVVVFAVGLSGRPQAGGIAVRGGRMGQNAVTAYSVSVKLIKLEEENSLFPTEKNTRRPCCRREPPRDAGHLYRKLASNPRATQSRTLKPGNIGKMSKNHSTSVSVKD